MGPREKTLGARTRTNNKLKPYKSPSSGIEPGSHWREVNATKWGKCSQKFMLTSTKADLRN